MRVLKPWLERLRSDLEPVLASHDPRPGLSAYAGMPCAIFWYPPDIEFELRAELTRLRTRLEAAGKSVHAISLSACVAEALGAHVSDGEIASAEENVGLAETTEMINDIVAHRTKLDEVVASRLPRDQDPFTDIVFIIRCGSVFPFYRPHPLSEQLMGRLEVPAVLFYPGTSDGPTSLSFMGVLAPDNNYRPKIF